MALRPTFEMVSVLPSILGEKLGAVGSNGNAAGGSEGMNGLIDKSLGPKAATPDPKPTAGLPGLPRNGAGGAKGLNLAVLILKRPLDIPGEDGA